jgi:hypothetical protein
MNDGVDDGAVVITRRRTRHFAPFALIVLVVTVAVAFCGALYLAETTFADPAAVQRVKKGMAYPQVVDILGVMYDRCYRGKYATIDEVIANMEEGDSISFVCIWRIRFSRNAVYIGFDKNEAVVAIEMKE